MARGTALFPVERNGVRIRNSLADALKQLEDHVRDNVLRSAAHAGAEVLYNELSYRVPVYSGTLASAIYRWHDKDKSQPGRQTYAIGVNKRKAPHWHMVEFGHWRRYRIIPTRGQPDAKFKDAFQDFNGQWYIPTKEPITPVFVPGTPYLRPTWEAKGKAAIDAMLARARQRIAEFKADQ